MTVAAEGYVTDVAYIPGFYPHMSPAALRYVAALNRIAPPKVADGFRYLELGCGLGRSLTTLAAANPRGKFIGVDVNPEHTAVVEKEIAAGKLKNARVLTADFSQLPKNLGECEFITIHGVLSWVAPEVRAQIIAIAKEHLAPGGLLLVSYNAMPGWAHLQPIRGILLQYAQLREGDSLQRIRDALAYLLFMREKNARYFEDNPRASAYIDGLLKQDVRYLAHEYLNEHWTSFYFAEVAGMFGKAGLTFVGSLPVFTNFWDLCVRPEFQELFRTTTNRLVTEAHKDFCANTAFRWDIYTKAPQGMPELADRLRDADDLYFHLSRPSITLPYEVNLGVVTSTVQGPLYQALIGVLSGQSLRLSEIIAAPELQGTPGVDLMRAVDAGVAMGLFDVTGGSLPASTAGLQGSVRIVHPLNATLLATESLSGRAIALASERSGTGHAIGDFEGLILHELAESGRGGLAGRVESRLMGSGRTLQQNGQAITDAAACTKIVADACNEFLTTSLPQLARLGVVTTEGVG